jgi:hypothetical protein
MIILRATAIVILAALIVLPACGREEPAPPPSGSSGAAASALPESSQQLLGLLPAGEEIPGWAMKGTPKFFGPGNLWEFINGAAEGYLAFGFQEVVSAGYTSGAREVVVDVYRMKDRVGAFGIYAQERNPDARFVKSGVEGYIAGAGVNFWAGDYYVKITSFEEHIDIQHATQVIATVIEKKIGPAGSQPAEMAWFPAADQVPYGVSYVPKDVLGQSYFAGAFEARYKAGPAEYKLLVIDQLNADAAGQAFASYRQFMSGQGRPVSDFSVQGGEQGFAGEDGFYGRVLAVRAGRHVAIALGAPSAAAGRDALALLLRNIK